MQRMMHNAIIFSPIAVFFVERRLALLYNVIFDFD